MCDNIHNYKQDYKPDAADTLARLMRKDLEVEVTAAQMRLFILARWERIKTLAHSIHDGKDMGQ